MKHLYILTGFTILSGVHGTLFAQEISVHRPPVDSVWHWTVKEGELPPQMSCRAGGSQNYRLRVSYSAITLRYKYDTIKTDKKELTDEDLKAIEDEFNKENQAHLDDLLEEKELDQEEELGSPSLMEVLLDDCENAFNKLLEKWNSESFHLCRPDCPPPILECIMESDHWVEGATFGYRLKIDRISHPAENDNEAEPPYEVEITYSLEYYSEAWVYFTITCVCTEIPGLVSVPPSRIEPPWDQVELTGKNSKLTEPFAIGVDRPFPWIPVIGGVVGAGVVTTLLLSDGENTDCVFSATSQTIAASCGRSDGSAMINVSPTDSYTYVWSNGPTTAAIQNVPPGTYTATVTRVGTDCNRVVNTTVTNTNPSFTATVNTIAAHCGQNDGSATINVSPPTSYTYTWSGGGTGTTQSNLAPGSYMVTVSAGGTCTETFNLTIGELPPEFEITIQPTPASCGQSDGSAFAVVTKGDYEIIWSDGSTGAVLSDVPAGEYTVTVTIAGTSCQKTSSVVIAEAPPDFTISFNTTAASCGSSNGSATVTAAPEGQYQILWSTGVTTPQITDVESGEYQVTVTLEGTTCSQSASVIIDEEPADITLTFTTVHAQCGRADGSATVTAEPEGQYQFQWSTGVTTPQITDVPSGEYQVTVTVEGTTCAQSASVIINEEPANFTLTINTTPAGCGIADASASVTVDPAGTYTFQWPGGSTLPQVEGLSPGTYILTVTDEFGCSSSGEFGITETPADFILDVITVPGNCLGEGADIIITTQTHASGPMQITATGPDGVHVVSAPPGVVNLNTFFTVLPGPWHLVVVDMSITSPCQEETDVQVDDITTFTSQDDNYQTTINQPVSGNLLDNDSGVNLSVDDHTEPSGGILAINADGSFTFTPPADATGVFSFQYTLNDDCGNSAIVNVTITVNSLDCLFDATFNVIPSNCGVTNGAITTVVIPDGNYTFAWSGGQSSQNLIDLPPGQYSITVTSFDLMCNHTYEIQVDEVQNSYASGVSTTPGNCTGEGDIHMTLETPGSGPLVLIVDGPEGIVQFSLAAGQHDLSSSMNIPSGDYTITVYDQGAGDQCSETFNVTVSDNTPALSPEDDFYQTPFNTAAEGNVLDNDAGLNLMLTDVFGIVGGEVLFFSDGFFIFTPDPGFSGTASFQYTVTDACGDESTAFVEIFVEEAVCDFTVDFTNTNASCGLSDGNSIVIVNPPDDYMFVWSTGVAGSVLSNVMAGMYDVTITDVNLGCDLTFGTQILEDPAMYVSNLVITQPMCPSGGEITFDVSSSAGGPFNISVSHPNGVDDFVVLQGTVTLSEHISITDGDYVISVIDLNAGPSCVDDFDASISGTSMLEIMVDAIIPPSEPTAMDGAIVIVTTVTGVLPYNIFLNGDSWGVAIDHSFIIGDLGAGDYTVQIQDANGCFSNMVNATVPFPGSLGLDIGFGLAMMQSDQIPLPEQPRTTGHTVVSSFVDVGLHYAIGGIKQVNSIAIYRDVYDYRDTPDNIPSYRFSHLVEIGRWRYKGFDLKAHGGMSLDVIRDIPAEQYWTITGSISKRIGKMMKAHATVSLRGWERIERPMIDVGVRMPVAGVQTLKLARLVPTGGRP